MRVYSYTYIHGFYLSQLVKDIDVSLKGGTSFGIYTTLHCITAMREYKQKSLEVGTVACVISYS